MIENRIRTLNHRGWLPKVRFLVNRAGSKNKILLVGVASLLALGSWAAPGDRDPAFSVPRVTGGFPTAIWALAVQSDGKILMGGNFSIVGMAARPGIARLNADGSLDIGFAPTNVPPDVHALAVQPDGKVVLGIGYPNGSTPSLMRLNADGSTDTNSTIGFTIGGTSLRGALSLLVRPDGYILAGGGTLPNTGAYLLLFEPTGGLDAHFARVANGKVEALALGADGRPYIAGAFTAPHPGIALLQTNGLAAPFVHDITTNPIIHALVVQPDGRLLVGGKFVRSGSSYGRTNIIRLTANGTFDPTFNAASGPDGDVRAITLLANNSIVVAGDFTAFAGQPCAGLVRLQPNGQLDTGFNAADLAGLSRPVVVLQNDGRIIVGGSCTNGHPLIRLLGAESVDAPPTVVVLGSQPRVTVGQSVALKAFVTSAGPFSCAWAHNGIPVDAATNATLKLTNLSVAQTGNYTVAVSNALGNAIASANLEVVATAAAVGTLDLTYNTGTRPQVMDGIFAIALQPDGSAVIGGGFSMFNGVPCTNLTRVDANGNVDPNFQAGRLASVTYPDWVQGLALQDDGDLLAVGSFTRHLVRFAPTGALDPAFSPSYSSPLYALALQSDKLMVVGGRVIRRLTANGYNDATFNAGGGPNQAVRTLALQPDGKILAGGDFTAWSGIARQGLVRLNAGGDLDYSFDARMTGAVAAVLVQPDGRIFVGGRFQAAGGAPRNGLARLNSDGSVDASYDIGSGFHSQQLTVLVAALALQPDGKMLVGGAFSSVDGASHRAVVRLNPDGCLDPTFDPGTGPDGIVYALALQPDGAVIIAGDFNNVSGKPRDRLARLLGDTPPPIGPSLGVPTITNGQVGVSFVSQPARKFTLELSDSLGPLQWMAGPSLLGDGSRRTLIDTNGLSSRRFYRVRVE